MKITIDTKEDSPADIRKVIALLSKMIEESPEHYSDIFGKSNPSSESSEKNAFANMFGDNNMPILPLGLSSEKIKEKESSEESSEETPTIIEY